MHHHSLFVSIRLSFARSSDLTCAQALLSRSVLLPLIRSPFPIVFPRGGSLCPVGERRTRSPTLRYRPLKYAANCLPPARPGCSEIPPRWASSAFTRRGDADQGDCRGR